MFGNQLRMPVPDVDRTDFFVILGGNPLVSNGSIMTAPNMKGRLAAIGERGGRVVVVDPRKTLTAEAADQHIFIRPGTDALLLLAIANTLFAEDLVRTGRLGAHIDGVEELRELALEFTPDSVSKETGIAAQTIAELARAAAAAERPVFYGRLGLCAQEFGGLAAWLINAVNILLGALDEMGGSMFPNPAFDLPGLAKRFRLLGHYDKYRSRVRNLPEFGGEFPVATMADEMLTEGKGQIRALMTVAGNPVLSTPNGRKLEGALAGLDFMVAVDPYINETTKHAHIILPPTTALERDHYDVAFGMFMVRNNAKYARAVFPRQEDQRHDWEIFAELWGRKSKGRGPLGSIQGAVLRLGLLVAGPKLSVAWALRNGPHKLSLGKLLRNPHGIDLGPLEPALPQKLETKDGRIPLVPAIYRDDLSRLREARESGDDFPLRLIGRRHLRSNNSWMHNSHRLVKGKDRCTLLMHSEDADRYALSSGDQSTLRSKVASVLVTIEVSDSMMPGVVSLPHGWGHSRANTRLSVAQAHPGVSLNDLTDDSIIDRLSGEAVLNGVPVQLQKDVALAAKD
jgi:anaerobic selenocysteine-containing dehydrogenase